MDNRMATVVTVFLLQKT